MRIVLDTNVFVSGIFFSGPPDQILKAWRDGKVQLLGWRGPKLSSPQVCPRSYTMKSNYFVVGVREKALQVYRNRGNIIHA